MLGISSLSIDFDQMAQLFYLLSISLQFFWFNNNN